MLYLTISEGEGAANVALVATTDRNTIKAALRALAKLGRKAAAGEADVDAERAR